MPVCPVFAAGLEGNCDICEHRPQGGKGRDRPPERKLRSDLIELWAD